jgi:hypothetical protein
MGGDYEDYKIIDGRGLTRALVYQHARSVEVRFPIDPYAAKVRHFASLDALERWVNQRRWRLVESEFRQLLRRPLGVQENPRMTDEEFARRYEITSLTGRVWTRSMVRRAALEQVRTSPLPGVRDLPARERASLVDRALDDDGFMRPRAGEIPARVVEAIEDRVWQLVRGY